MMKAHYIFISLIALLLAACEKKENVMSIKGEFENIDQAEFYIYCNGANFTGIDTIKIEDGEFEYELEMPEKDIVCLLYPNYSETHIIGEPGANIRIKGSASDLNLVEVGGTEENELLTAFRLTNAGRAPKEKAMAVADFIRSHPTSMAAVSVWANSFARIEQVDVEARQLLDILMESQGENSTLRRFNEQTRALVSVIEGKQLPDFKVITVKGDTVRKSDYAGKPLLIAFWANWQSESGMYIKDLIRHQKEQPEKFKILHISLDATTVAAKRTLSTDSTETLVCDSLMFDTPLALRFGVRFVPSTILVDETGKVIARDLPLKKLHEVLKTL